MLKGATPTLGKGKQMKNTNWGYSAHRAFHETESLRERVLNTWIVRQLGGNLALPARVPGANFAEYLTSGGGVTVARIYSLGEPLGETMEPTWQEEALQEVGYYRRIDNF